jgi:hypothetical protein
MKSKISDRKSPMPDEPLVITSYQAQRRNVELHCQQMTQEEAQVLDYLTLNCQGAKNKVTIPVLNQRLWPDWRRARQIRGIVKRLRLLRWKIGSSSNPRDPGLFIIRDVSELNNTVKGIMTHAIAELRTVEALTGQGHYSAELCKRVIRL